MWALLRLLGAGIIGAGIWIMATGPLYLSGFYALPLIALGATIIWLVGIE